jgi:hypothetical protein
MRTYTVQNGATRTSAHLRNCGPAIQREVLGNLIAYLLGNWSANQIIHLWGFSDLNDRQLRRARLEKTRLARVPHDDPSLHHQPGDADCELCSVFTNSVKRPPGSRPSKFVYAPKCDPEAYCDFQ